MNHFTKLVKTIFNLIYPPLCEVCNTKLTMEECYICNSCFRRIKINSPPFCGKCSRHIGYDKGLCDECIKKKSYLEKVWSFGIYDDVLKECLHLFKYKRKIYLVRIFKKYIFEFCDKNIPTYNLDLIVPIPLHHTKLEERTFNQSEILAKIISLHYKIKMINALIKVRATKPQNTLNKFERSQNVRGAFKACGGKSICNKKILLVDDIFTTGSTINECARTLIEKGAKKIYGFTLARGV